MDRPAKRSKLMERADEHVTKGEYYEALMLYKGQVARGTAEKVTSVCTDGVAKLSANGQHKLAAELGVTAVEKLGLQVAELLVSKMSEPTQLVFLQDVLTWVKTHASPSHNPRSIQSLNRMLGMLLTKTTPPTDPATLAKAQYYLSQGGPNTAAPMLALTTAWASPNPAETPLFHARTFLLYLLSDNPTEAAQYISLAPPAPLTSLCSFLYTAVHKGSHSLFKHIVDKSNLLKVDPCLAKVIAGIDSKYFNDGSMCGSAPPPVPAQRAPAVAPASVPVPAPSAPAPLAPEPAAPVAPAPPTPAAPASMSHPDLD